MSTRIRSLMLTGACALAALVMLAAPASAEDEVGSRVAGYMSLDVNTNFMSYGFDVWQTGNFGDADFNPSMGFTFDLGKGFSFDMGTWWDVNNNAVSSIGGEAIQEVDVWGGLSYAYEKFSIGLTYQEWMYGGGSERILDTNFAYDVMFSPFILIHARVGSNHLGQETGAVFVFGGEYGFDLGPVGFAIPVAVAALTKDYYIAGEGGFGYFTAGLQASVPLSFIPAAYGEWAFNGGGTYYYSSPDNIGNSDDNIFAMNAGISLAF